MKTNELMIGDFIQFSAEHSSPLKPKKVQVFGVKYSKELSKYLLDIVFCDSGAIQYNYNLDIFSGIPLTPEILEKNGFTRYGQVYASLQQWVGKFGDKRKSFVQDIRTGEWGINDVWINFVHELQHALRLSGIDKEIEL